MKRIITVLATLLVIVSCTRQQGDVVEENKQDSISNSITQIVKKDTLSTPQKGDSIKRSSQDSILDMLSRIVEVQVSTYNQRMRAYENYMKSKEDLKNDADSSSVPTEYSVLSTINDNTSFDFLGDDFSLSNSIAIIISIAACIFAIMQYQSQKLTEEHTKKVPISLQREKIKDLPRHFYRNLVCTCALIYKFIDEENQKDGKRMCYPSEVHIYKLHTLPDDIFLPIDVEEKFYSEMHKLKLEFRNYNIEIDVASNHVKMRDLGLDALKSDFDNILFKPLFLTKNTFEYGTLLKLENPKNNAKIRIINEHYKKLLENLPILMDPKYPIILRKLMSDNFAYIKSSIDRKDNGAIERSLDKIFKKDDKIKIIDILSPENKINSLIALENVDEKTFETWFLQVLDCKVRKDFSVSNLYNALKPYLDYICNNNECEFVTLFYYILAVDIAIESFKVGMINYAVK